MGIYKITDPETLYTIKDVELLLQIIYRDSDLAAHAYKILDQLPDKLRLKIGHLSYAVKGDLTFYIVDNVNDIKLGEVNRTFVGTGFLGLIPRTVWEVDTKYHFPQAATLVDHLFRDLKKRLYKIISDYDLSRNNLIDDYLKSKDNNN